MAKRRRKKPGTSRSSNKSAGTTPGGGSASKPVGDGPAASGAPSPGGKSLPQFVLGFLTLVSGVVVLLYPAFQTRAGFHDVVRQFEYAPLVGVLLAALGVGALIRGLSKTGHGEAPFALDIGGPFVAKVKRELNPWRFFVLTWQELDREAEEERRARAAAGHTGYDWRPIAVFSLGAVFLGLMEYFGHKPHLNEFLAYLHAPHQGGPDHWVDDIRASAFFARRGQSTGLLGFAWWSGWRVLGFFLLPAFVIKVILRENISDYGLQTKGFLEHAWIYAFFFAIVLVLVVVVSYEESFQTYYPFYRDASRSWYDFWTWELLYAAQFFSLEFFFRGFWLKANKRAMGSHAIFAMTVPYVMIHFGKPFPETLAAILAGIALGTLALRTRSIWSGFLIHVSVAISMDIAALLQKPEGLATQWWPDL